MIETPRSTTIYAVNHDPVRNVLSVIFRQSKDRRMPGRHFTYENVNADQFHAMMAAPSIGKHFANYIKRYPQRHPYRLVKIGINAKTQATNQAT